MCAFCLFFCFQCVHLFCSLVICGDGLRRGSEECDDGNTASKDGCSHACVVEGTYTCLREHANAADICGIVHDARL